MKYHINKAIFMTNQNFLFGILVLQACCFIFICYGALTLPYLTPSMRLGLLLFFVLLTSIGWRFFFKGYMRHRRPLLAGDLDSYSLSYNENQLTVNTNAWSKSYAWQDLHSCLSQSEYAIQGATAKEKLNRVPRSIMLFTIPPKPLSFKLWVKLTYAAPINVLQPYLVEDITIIPIFYIDGDLKKIASEIKNLHSKATNYEL